MHGALWMFMVMVSPWVMLFCLLCFKIEFVSCMNEQIAIFRIRATKEARKLNRLNVSKWKVISPRGKVYRFFALMCLAVSKQDCWQQFSPCQFRQRHMHRMKSSRTLVSNNFQFLVLSSIERWGVEQVNDNRFKATTFCRAWFLLLKLVLKQFSNSESRA